MRFKFKKALALLSAAAMCGGIALSYPDGTFSLDVFASTESTETALEGNWTDYASETTFTSDSSATYEIDTPEDFAAFAKAVNECSYYWYGTVKLTADIDLSGHYWLPIGNNNNDFKGTFDGQGYTISNMTVDTEGLYFVGLFGRNCGTIKNVNIDSTCSVTGTKVSGYAFLMGAICGKNNSGTIENCSNAGDVAGTEDVGGICGSNSGTVQNCYNTGKITGTDDIGGISGENNNSTITNCHNSGDVTGTNYVGGICGYNSNAPIANCYNTGIITADTYTGEIIGYDSGSTGNSYYLADSDDGNGGKTAEQFASGEVAYLLSQGCTLSYFDYYYYNYVEKFFSGEGWGQNLKTADSDTDYDAYPVLSDAVVYTGYETSYCGNTEADRLYSNTEFTVTSIPEHSYENGVCTECTEICSHESYSEGDCDECDVVCTHESYTNGDCDECDIVCEHISYTDGKCDICEIICEHESYTNGDCDVCDIVCSHGSYTNGICDECESYEDGIGAKLAGYSLSLEGNIGVYFYMELDESVIADSEAYMQFTLGGKELSQVKVSDAAVDTETVEGKTYYVFKCEVPAKDMDTTISAQIVLSDGTKGTVYEYTIKEYADYILDEANGYDEVTRNLASAMLSYGDYAEAYFNGTELAATEAMNAVTADTLAEYACSVTDENSLYYGSSLILKSNTIIRHYFTEEVTGSTHNGDLWYIDTESIAADKLGTAITTEVDGITISYSPLSYAYKALSSDTTSDSLKNLAKAIHLYYQATEAYVNYA